MTIGYRYLLSIKNYYDIHEGEEPCMDAGNTEEIEAFTDD